MSLPNASSHAARTGRNRRVPHTARGHRTQEQRKADRVWRIDRRPTRVCIGGVILTSPTLPQVRERFRPVAFIKREVRRLNVTTV